MAHPIDEEKKTLRIALLEVRKNIPPERRQEAQEQLLNRLPTLLQSYSSVLSYSNIGTELETQQLNEVLRKAGKLVLPRVEGDVLELFHVDVPLDQLSVNSWGIKEPSLETGTLVMPEEVSCALVPGIAFDSVHHRLGYGKGFYDKLLRSFPESAVTYGLAFREQYQHVLMPRASHDVVLKALLLF